MNVIEVNELTKYYGRTRGVEGITFNVPEGSVFGFIGPNGAGKSTTIRILMSLIFAGSGSAQVLGMDCGKMGHLIRQKVGYIPAEANFYDEMKVKDFLSYASGFYMKSDRKRLSMLCDLLDVDTGKKVGSLSSGNKRKLAILQALLHEPSLLILDEPTTGLDPLMQNHLYDLLREENRKGVTVFFSSHVLSEVEKMCDEVAIVKEGRVLKTERVDKLRGSMYKKVRVEFADQQDLAMFQSDEMTAYMVKGRQAEFIYHGRVDSLMKRVAAHETMNIWIEEPSLEDIFLHYYGKGDE